MEQSRTDVYNGLLQVNWAEYKASSGLELKGYNVDNFNLGPVEAYCSEEGAVVKKCETADLNCFAAPGTSCKCNKDTGAITKCSKHIYAKMFITNSLFLCSLPRCKTHPLHNPPTKDVTEQSSLISYWANKTT